MYTFKLQAVLDHRQYVEDNLKKELADIREQLMMTQRQLETLKRKEMNAIEALRQEQVHGLGSNQVVAYQSYLKRLSDSITRQMTMVTENEAQEAAKQDELLEAMKKRQILEKLKDQGLDRYNQVLLKKEMNFIDEIAVNQFARKTIRKSGDSR